MKSGRRIAIILLPPLMVFIYVFITKDINFGSDSEAKEAGLVKISLPSETKNIKFHFDELKPVKLNGKTVLSLRGWVFKENVKEKNRDLFLVLKSKGETLIFKIDKNGLKRPDVTAANQLVGGNDGHGFELLLPIHRLKDNIYQTGFIIEDKTGKFYSLTNRMLKLSNGEASLFKVGALPAKGEETISHQISLRIQKPGKKVNYCFDKVETKEKSIIVIGWGFLKGFDDDSLKSYVLLKKNAKVNIFDVQVRERKDITKAYRKYGFQLDSTGFKAKILTNNLEAGKYQLGLYITKGDKSGVVYADKFIDLGK